MVGSVLTDYLVELLNAHKNDLGIKRVYYGDQEHIPELPAVCVEPSTVQRELVGTAMRTNNLFLISILVYCANVEGVEDAQHDADQFAEAVMRAINNDGTAQQPLGTRFGGHVIYGYVQTSEYGYIVKLNKLMRANRMLVFAHSKTNLLEA
jgi:hypothetical protein